MCFEIKVYLLTAIKYVEQTIYNLFSTNIQLSWIHKNEASLLKMSVLEEKHSFPLYLHYDSLLCMASVM